MWRRNAVSRTSWPRTDALPEVARQAHGRVGGEVAVLRVGGRRKFEVEVFGDAVYRSQDGAQFVVEVVFHGKNKGVTGGCTDLLTK